MTEEPSQKKVSPAAGLSARAGVSATEYSALLPLTVTSTGSVSSWPMHSMLMAAVFVPMTSVCAVKGRFSATPPSE